MEDKLGMSEYEEVLIDNISTVVVPRSYLEQNRDFWNGLVFKLFEVYHYSIEPVSIRKQAQMLEIFFSSLFSYQPSIDKPEDILNL